MADEPVNGSGLDISVPPFGKLHAGGAAMVIVILMIIVLAVFEWEGFRRGREHDEIECLLKLDLWIHRFPQGNALDFAAMPSDLWSCLPRNELKSEIH